MNNQNSLTNELSGAQATDSIIAGTKIIRKISSSILGPKGSLKLLTHPDGKTTITNDGATVLKNLLIDHAVSQIVINSSISQDWEEGDGTTSVAVLASTFIENAKTKMIPNSYTTNSLITKSRNLNNLIKPIDFIKGFEKASLKALEVIERSSMRLSDKELEKLAYTTLNSKITGKESDRFASLCVEAIKRISCRCGVFEEEYTHEKNYTVISKEYKNKDPETKTTESSVGSCKCDYSETIDLNMISIQKQSGPISNSFIVPGLLIKSDNVIDQKIHPKILTVNTNLDNVKVKLSLTKVEVSKIDEMVKIEEMEKERIKNKVDKITSQEFDVLVNRQIVYDLPMSMLEDKGVEVVENVGFDMIERASKLCNSMVVSTFEGEQSKYGPEMVGKCHSIDTIKIGSDKYIRMKSCSNKCEGEKDNKNAKSCSIVLFSSTVSGCDELERSIHDALCVISKSIKERKVIYGGGNIEVSIATELYKMAAESTGIESMVIRLYADSVLEIPKVLVQNGGGNADDVVERLIAMRKKNFYTTNGVDLSDDNKGVNGQGFVGCMKKQGIFESVEVKKRIISAATECAQTVIKCDTLIKCSPRERTKE